MSGEKYLAKHAGLMLILVTAMLTIMPLAYAETPAVPPSGGDVTALTDSGLVRGKVSDDGDVEIYQGIPYAAPPVANLRWAPPQPPAHWSGTRDAFEPGSPCPQTGRLASVNEDCLYLNVWAPREPSRDRLPVIVWIHGGGQLITTGSEYDGSRLVTRGTPVIAVTINYRLNIFAFFAHAELTAEDAAMGSGNYATLDQQFALKWVKRNIANFGGDPDNVTIAGESGGGQAVCILLVSPPAAGLFQRAITESAPCQDQYYPTLTASEAEGMKIASELGCSDVACLRKLPVAVLLAKQTGTAPVGQPATGGGAFPLPIRHAIAFGQFNKVPVMEGSTKDEALFFVPPAYDGVGKKVTEAQYPQIIATLFGEARSQAILEQYPTSNYPTPSYALVAVETDSAENGEATRNRLGACNTELANQLLAPWVPVYAYEFADENDPWPIPLFPLSTGGMKGAGHTSELPYLWKMDVPLSDAQQRLSTTMIKYWTNFAAHGDPNGDGLPAWPKFTSSSPQYMTFRTDRVAADATFRDVHKCKFWSEQGWANLYGSYDAPFPTH